MTAVPEGVHFELCGVLRTWKVSSSVSVCLQVLVCAVNECVFPQMVIHAALWMVNRLPSKNPQSTLCHPKRSSVLNSTKMPSWDVLTSDMGGQSGMPLLACYATMSSQIYFFPDLSRQTMVLRTAPLTFVSCQFYIASHFFIQQPSSVWLSFKHSGPYDLTGNYCSTLVLIIG